MTLETLTCFKTMRIFTVFLFFLMFAMQSIAADNGVIIKKIEIKNSQRVEEATILSYLQIKVGDKFSQEKINASLKEMYSTELFSNITMDMDGNTLVVKVQENPIINKI